jgi:hypothetical protein
VWPAPAKNQVWIEADDAAGNRSVVGPLALAPAMAWIYHLPMLSKP